MVTVTTLVSAALLVSMVEPGRGRARGLNQAVRSASDGGAAVTGRQHAFLWRDGKMRDLGTLAGKESVAWALNRGGQVVGWSDTRDGGHAMLWHRGKITDLGTLPGSRSKVSYALAINDRGQIAGTTQAQRSSGAWGPAFLWQQGKMTSLGTLGGNWSRVSDINERGQIVGSSEPPGAVMRGFLSQRGNMTDLGTLGGEQSVALAINEGGQVAGYSDLAQRPGDPNRHTHAFRWKDGVMIDLGTLGGNESYAGALNERGQIVGSSEVAAGSPGQRHAFLWQDGAMRDLGTLGGKESYAWALNERGQVVGKSRTAGGAWHAYLWQDGKMRDLGTLGGEQSDATAINERGQVIGTSTTAKGATRPFIWQNGKMRDLGTLGGQTGAPAAINDRGEVAGTSDSVSPPKPPPQSRQTIAYTALHKAAGSVDPVPGVYTIDIDGSHRRQVADYGSSPAWSPDGERIAYSEQVIFVAAVDGTKPREVDVGPGFCSQPTWSPDGRQIACVAWWYTGASPRMRYHTALYAVDLRTGRQRKLVPGVHEGTVPSWSPDGDRIAFDDGGIVMLDLKTNRKRRLGSGSTPDWSPDGATIAYSTGRTIAVMKSDGSARRTVVRSNELVADPSWSPDGSRIVYAQFTRRSARGLFIVGVDGGERRLLVRGGFDPDWRPR